MYYLSVRNTGLFKSYYYFVLLLLLEKPINYEKRFWFLLYTKSSSAAGRTENGLLTPSLRMDAPVSGVSTY